MGQRWQQGKGPVCSEQTCLMAGSPAATIVAYGDSYEGVFLAAMAAVASLSPFRGVRLRSPWQRPGQRCGLGRVWVQDTCSAAIAVAAALSARGRASWRLLCGSGSDGSRVVPWVQSLLSGERSCLWRGHRGIRVGDSGCTSHLF